MGGMSITKHMDFGQALAAMIHGGARVSRYEWGYDGVFVVYQKGYPQGIAINANTAEATGIPEGTTCVFQPYLMTRTGDGSFSPWVPTQEDILATDWYESAWTLNPPDRFSELS